MSAFGQLNAQSQVRSIIQNYLVENAGDLGVTQQDVSSWEITDDVFSQRNGIRHVHIVQTRNGIPLKNGVANITLNNKNEVLYVGNRLIPNVDALLPSSQPKIGATSALSIAAKHLGMDVAALSIITDLGIEGIVEEVSHEEVQKAAREAEPKMSSIVKTFLASI